MTKQQIKAELFNAIRNEGLTCEVEKYFNDLVFFGASVSDCRGVSDAGLNSDELEEVIGRVGNRTAMWITESMLAEAFAD